MVGASKNKTVLLKLMQFKPLDRKELENAMLAAKKEDQEIDKAFVEYKQSVSEKYENMP